MGSWPTVEIPAGCVTSVRPATRRGPDGHQTAATTSQGRPLYVARFRLPEGIVLPGDSEPADGWHMTLFASASDLDLSDPDRPLPSGAALKVAVPPGRDLLLWRYSGGRATTRRVPLAAGPEAVCESLSAGYARADANTTQQPARSPALPARAHAPFGLGEMLSPRLDVPAMISLAISGEQGFDEAIALVARKAAESASAFAAVLSTEAAALAAGGPHHESAPIAASAAAYDPVAEVVFAVRDGRDGTPELWAAHLRRTLAVELCEGRGADADGRRPLVVREQAGGLPPAVDSRGTLTALRDLALGPRGSLLGEADVFALPDLNALLGADGACLVTEATDGREVTESIEAARRLMAEERAERCREQPQHARESERDR